MDAKTKAAVEEFVRTHIGEFHDRRTEKLHELKLNDILRRKNPYLFRAKNINAAPDLISAVLEARLSSSEEGSFGGFLEELAIFVAELCGGGQKAGMPGIDIDLTRKGVRYLIAVKSGKDWGNSSQHAQLRRSFREAVRIIKQSKRAKPLQPTLGICYGKFKTTDNGEYLHIGGQSFWHLLSEDKGLYVDIVEPLGHRAADYQKEFEQEKAATFNRLVREFTNEYCDPRGQIDWEKLVGFVSRNMQ